MLNICTVVFSVMVRSYRHSCFIPSKQGVKILQKTGDWDLGMRVITHETNCFKQLSSPFF